MAWNAKRSSFIVDDIHSDFLAELMPGGAGDSNDFSYFGPQGSKNDNYFGSSFSPSSAPYRSSFFMQQEPQGFTRLASFAALNRASFQQSNKEAGWEVVTDHCKNLQSIALYFAATSNSVTNLAYLDFFSHVLRLLQMTLKLRPESIPFDQLKGQFHELFPSDETSNGTGNSTNASSSSSTPSSITDTDPNPPGPPSPQVSSSPATNNPHPLSQSSSASNLPAPSSSPQHQQSQQQQQHLNIQTGLSQGVLSKAGQNNNSSSSTNLMTDFAMNGPPPPAQSAFNSSTMAQFSSMNSLSNAYQQQQPPSQQQFQQPQFTTQQQGVGQNNNNNIISFYGQQPQPTPFQMQDGFGMSHLGNNSGTNVVGGKSLEQQKNDALSAPVNLSASSSTNSSGTSGLGVISNNSSNSNLNLSNLSNLTGLSSRSNAGNSANLNNNPTNNVVGSSSSMFSGAYSQQVAPQLGLRPPNDHSNTTMGLPVSNTPNYLPPTVFTSNPFSGLPVSAQHNLMSRNHLLPISAKPPLNQSPEKQVPGQQQPLQQPQHLQYLPPQLQQQQQSQQQQPMLPITHANLHAHLQAIHPPGQPFLRPKDPSTSTSNSVAGASATLDLNSSDSSQMNKMMGAGFMMIPGMSYPGDFGKGMMDGSGDPGWPKRKRKRVMSRTNLKCRICQETETPEWRKGPDGNHTLCNACGLNYAKKLKQERQVLEKAGRRRTSIDTILEDKKFHFSDLIASERAKKSTEKRPNPLRTTSHSSQFPSEDGSHVGSAEGDDQFSVPPPASSSPSNSSFQSVKTEHKHDEEDDDDEYDDDDDDLQNNGSTSSGNDNDEAMRDFGNSRNAPGPSSHLNPANFGNNLQQQQQQYQQQQQQQQQQQFGFNQGMPSRAESMSSLMNPNLNLNMGLSHSGPKLESSQSLSSLQQLQQQQQQGQGQGQNQQRPY